MTKCWWIGNLIKFHPKIHNDNIPEEMFANPPRAFSMITVFPT